MDTEVNPDPAFVHAAAKHQKLQRWVAGIAGVFFVLVVLPFTYVYVKFSRIVDQKLQSGPFGSASNFYASPRTLTPGEEIS
ncbi:MAG: hypothetical protein M3Z23_15975, partial [Acidobacteriota bacterium]|nr:hypothetical protein [Acidobacteriota bacterium]